MFVFIKQYRIRGNSDDTYIKQYEMKENCILKEAGILAKYDLHECLLRAVLNNFALYQTSCDGH